MLPALFPPVHSLVRDRLSNELAATGMTATGGTGVHPLCPEHPFLPWCPHRAAPAPRDPSHRVGTAPWDAPALQNRERRKEKGGPFLFHLENIISGCPPRRVQQGPLAQLSSPPPRPLVASTAPPAPHRGHHSWGRCICHRSLSS